MYLFCISNVNYHKPTVGHIFQFLLVDRNHSRSKNPIWYIFPNFYCSFMWQIFQKHFKKVWFSRQNFLKMANFREYFSLFSLQRIFFAKIFFVCKDSLFAIQYISRYTWHFFALLILSQESEKNYEFLARMREKCEKTFCPILWWNYPLPQKFQFFFSFQP